MSSGYGDVIGSAIAGMFWIGIAIGLTAGFALVGALYGIWRRSKLSLSCYGLEPFHLGFGNIALRQAIRSGLLDPFSCFKT